VLDRSSFQVFLNDRLGFGTAVFAKRDEQMVTVAEGAVWQPWQPFDETRVAANPSTGASGRPEGGCLPTLVLSAYRGAGWVLLDRSNHDSGETAKGFAVSPAASTAGDGSKGAKKMDQLMPSGSKMNKLVTAKPATIQKTPVDRPRRSTQLGSARHRRLTRRVIQDTNKAQPANIGKRNRHAHGTRRHHTRLPREPSKAWSRADHADRK
jgi:hypothetical protein